MKIAQEINTHRAMTIAGSVALLALTAYGVWKWNSSGKVFYSILFLESEAYKIRKNNYGYYSVVYCYMCLQGKG